MPDTPTPRLGLYKSASDGSELVNYTQDIGQNLTLLDAAVGYQSCTSSTRPSSPYSGKPIMETDTAYRTYFSNGTSPASASWVQIPNSSSTFNADLDLTSGKQLNIGSSSSTASIAVLATATTDDIISTRISGDTVSRYLVEADGAQYWGPGGSAPVDTNLYRSAANTLKTDDGLIVTGTLSSATSGITYKAIQSGTETVNFSAVTQQDATVTFPVAFASTPYVFVSINNSPSGSSKIHIRATSVSTTGFTMRFQTGDATAATTTGLTGAWHAFVP